jgi:succinate dehydrogenase / fumarate reductase cytochrome b subunit
MSWVTEALGTSVGKKLMMSITGLCFVIFLFFHLAGNLSLFGGKEFFLSYVEHLHALGVLITVAEWGLLTLAVIHILTGLFLFFQNFAARPNRYRVNANAGGRSLGSMTMPYTGLVILVFVIYHLFDFHFVDKSQRDLFQIVTASFANPGVAIFYIFAVIVAAIHVSHGFWSAFQTLGANHPKYMPALRVIGILFSIAVGAGFGFIPVYLSMTV